MKTALLTVALIAACAGSGELLAQATPTRIPAAHAARGVDAQQAPAKTLAVAMDTQDNNARLRVAAVRAVDATLPR
jgi:L-asparaginase II